MIPLRSLRLTVLETIGNHTERQGLYLGLGILCRRAVRENAGQLWHLGEPPAIVLSPDLDPESHVPTDHL